MVGQAANESGHLESTSEKGHTVAKKGAGSLLRRARETSITSCFELPPAVPGPSSPGFDLSGLRRTVSS